MADLVWSDKAYEDMDRLDKMVAKRIANKITWLSGNIEKIVPEPLSGEYKSAYKLRVGPWRIIYSFENE